MPLNYKVIGEGEPVIILHGLFGMLDNWQSVAKYLARDHMVFLVDLRNHGKSFHSDEWNLLHMAEDVIRFMEEQWIYKATIIGHSMGGKVAMQMAMMNEDMVERLIIVDIAPKAYQRGHDKIFQALQSVPLEQLNSRKEVEEVLSRYIEEYSVRQFLMKNIKRKKEGGFQWKMNLPVIHENYENILKEIDSEEVFEKPTLFIKGEKSDYILEEDLGYNKILFPKQELVIIEDAGHWVHADQKDQFVETVSTWIKNGN